MPIPPETPNRSSARRLLGGEVTEVEAWAEAELVRLAQAGSVSAFDELARRYRRALWFEALRVLRDEGLAEDATQDAMLIAYRALPGLREVARFPFWLRSIARHRAIRLAQGEARQRTALDELLLRHSRSLAEPMAEISGEVGCAIQCLPEQDRLALQLHYLEGWPIAQVARYLGLSESNVKWRMHQARKKVRAQVAPEETQP